MKPRPKAPGKTLPQVSYSFIYTTHESKQVSLDFGPAKIIKIKTVGPRYNFAIFFRGLIIARAANLAFWTPVRIEF
ncbi:MAG: hypothetical protein ABSB22_19140 [Thermodesulfobacteriota bacterium]